MKINTRNKVKCRAVASQATGEVVDLTLLENVFVVRLVIYSHTHDERFLKAKAFMLRMGENIHVKTMHLMILKGTIEHTYLAVLAV